MTCSLIANLKNDGQKSKKKERQRVEGGGRGQNSMGGVSSGDVFPHTMRRPRRKTYNEEVGIWGESPVRLIKQVWGTRWERECAHGSEGTKWDVNCLWECEISGGVGERKRIGGN